MPAEDNNVIHDIMPDYSAGACLHYQAPTSTTARHADAATKTRGDLHGQRHR